MPKPGTPVIRNVEDIRGPVKGLEFVHFTDAQWARATKNLPVGKAPPKRGLLVEGIKSQYGGMLLMARCSGGPGEICITQLIWRDGRPQYQCSCTKIGGDSRPPESACRLVIVRTPFPRLACEQGTCGGTCRIEISGTATRPYIYCRCT